MERVEKDNNQQLQLRVSSNYYRDRSDDYVVLPFDFTADVDQVVRQLADQSAHGGGDYPEAEEKALDNAINDHKWSKEARARLLFLVLDAPPHKDAQVLDELHDAIRKAANQGIRIIPVALSGVNQDTEYVLRAMSIVTGGKYVFLTDHSGVGNEHLEPTVGEYEIEYLNDLLVDLVNEYVK